MMNEDKRKEAQKRLEDEERVRRLREGGESMKAQLAMEEAQRSSQDVEGRNYLTPQEQKRREMLQEKGPYRGYGESQQAQMAMWEQQRGGERYAGEGGYQQGQETMEERTAREIRREYRGEGAGPVPQYGPVPASEEELRLRDQTLRGTAPATDRPKTEYGVEAPGGKGFGMEPARGGTETYRREPTKDELRKTGSDLVDYPAGRGTYYSETFERPTGTTGPESSFGRTERMPSGRQYAEGGMTERQVQEGRMGAAPGPETRAPGTMGQATGAVKEKGGMAVEKGKEYGNVAMTKGKEVGSTVVSKTKDVTSQLSTKAKEFNENNRAEDIAHRAGESLGRAIRKTVSVAREMSSGFRRGMGREEEMRQERESVGEAPRRETTEREEYTRQGPGVEEKHYQEVRKRENQ